MRFHNSVVIKTAPRDLLVAIHCTYPQYCDSVLLVPFPYRVCIEISVKRLRRIIRDRASILLLKLITACAGIYAVIFCGSQHNVDINFYVHQTTSRSHHEDFVLVLF